MLWKASLMEIYAAVGSELRRLMQGAERLACRPQTYGAQSSGRVVLCNPGPVVSRGALQALCFSRQVLDLCELQVKHKGCRGCSCPHERRFSRGPLLCVWLLALNDVAGCQGHFKAQP